MGDPEPTREGVMLGRRRTDPGVRVTLEEQGTDLAGLKLVGRGTDLREEVTMWAREPGPDRG